ncbi:hypothetical protein [Priestia megaterium]|uniref:hypothetical protein n=1 Tax=Priestia megaterium TaxID=1404 RepID=UPI0028773E02|nr:hypothetical protein [Priestia megaterium]
MKKIKWISFILLLILSGVFSINHQYAILLAAWTVYGMALSILVYFFSYDMSDSNKE